MTILDETRRIPWNKGLNKESDSRIAAYGIKIALTQKGRKCKPFSMERRRKLSEASRGHKNPFYGKRHTKETIEKTRNAKLGHISWNNGYRGYKTKPCSDERKRKISLANKGLIRTKECREQMSKSRRAMLLVKPHPMLGKSRSEETKKRISQSLKDANKCAEYVIAMINQLERGVEKSLIKI